ncbi:MAG: glycosyltransferase family 2 protein [Candidatus Omnitrophica bacterium]|nr:glycosyltransferase family 2 protein [Candidatus Omnitrophota bacterium]
MGDAKILVIVPAFNESGNITKTIDELKQLDFSFDIVVIDDGSTDKTVSDAMAAGACVIALPFNLGIGGAVQTGLQYASRNGYTVAAQVDGDGQHDVRYLKVILEPVISKKVDIVVGSRFMPEDVMSEGMSSLSARGIQRQPSWRSSAIRRVGIHFFAWLISYLTSYRVTDPTSGFRAFGPKAIAIFSEKYPQDFPEPESMMSAKRFGLRLMEVPVQMRKREHGHSSIRYFKTLYYMIKVTIAILLDMLKPRKVI